MNPSSVKIARLRMSIVEKNGEAQLLKNKKSFVVVVQEDEGQIRLIGKRVEGKMDMYPIPGAPLELNGLETFSDISEAIYTSSEAVRQGNQKGTVAYFNLELI